MRFLPPLPNPQDGIAPAYIDVYQGSPPSPPLSSRWWHRPPKVARGSYGTDGYNRQGSAVGVEPRYPVGPSARDMRIGHDRQAVHVDVRSM